MLRPRGLAEWVSAIWVVIASAVLLCSLLLMADGFGALDRRQAVLFDRTPALSGAQAARVGPIAMEDSRDVGGARLVRLVVGPYLGDVAPPSGIPRWPAPGEVVASPAAAQMISTNPYAAALAPGRIIAPVGRAALRDPDEAYVIVGVTNSQAQAAGGLSIAGFGSNDSVVGDVTSSQIQKTAGFATLVLGGGCLVLVTTVTRLAGLARRRRLAVLQLMGASTAVVAGLTAMVVAVLAGVGAVLGTLVAWPAQQIVAEVGVSGIRWWPGSGWSRPPVQLLLGLATTVILASAARRTVDQDPWRLRRNTAERTASTARLIPGFLGGCVLVGVMYVQQQNVAQVRGLSGAGTALLFAALLLLVVGVPLSAPVITRAAAAAVRSWGLVWRVAGARASCHTRSTARLSGAMMMLVLITGVTLGVWNFAHSLYDRAGGGVLTVTIEPAPGASWVKAAATQVLGRPDLLDAYVYRGPGSGAAAAEPIRSPQDLRQDDVEYGFVLTAEGARAVAAQIETAHPGSQRALFNHDLAGPYGVMAGGAMVLLAQYLSSMVVVLALAASVLTLQQDRAVPDAALLLSGLSRSRLRRARAAEVVLVLLPAVALSVLVASFVMHAASHIDDPTVAVPGRPVVALGLAAVAACVLLAGVAAAGTPGLDSNAGRLRDR